MSGVLHRGPTSPAPQHPGHTVSPQSHSSLTPTPSFRLSEDRRQRVGWGVCFTLHRGTGVGPPNSATSLVRKVRQLAREKEESVWSTGQAGLFPSPGPGPSRGSAARLAPVSTSGQTRGQLMLSEGLSAQLRPEPGLSCVKYMTWEQNGYIVYPSAGTQT